ncbi:hypothetical protein CLV62_103197 [Dysgonomonas alginatilytica]|uniref:Dolichyl-phosphate-mannose-protein mannosyltransferase n=1 Tax=Dysgonomonas alginatilytica TaxID=1605892 RepID=A0A2V3PV08_9BACT|nr:DUF6080 domain-containing protein [Dysgonomonas alginatilytica]PXV67524.1 hypothetical protein CLV62_103197 [Dysgonomonas alginatilytica]
MDLRKNILHHLLPENRKEVIILCSVMLFYFSYSIIIAFYTSIIDHETLADLYFSFDNNIIYQHGYQSIVPHPLMRFLTSPIIFVGDWLALLSGSQKAKTLLWIIFCNYMISGSVLFIFKYLRNIINLGDNISILISMIFVITPINLILCFTPESFTISIYIITFILYYTAYSIKHKTDIPILEKVILSVIAMGITITNFIICTLPYIYFKKTTKEKIKDLTIIGIFAGIVVAWIGLSHHFIADTKTRLVWFTHTTGQLYEHIIDLFWGSPIFSPELWIHKLRNDDADVISMGYYHHWWQYLFIGILTGLIILSFIRNYKKNFVQILFLILLFNLVIHVYIRYGLDEPFMFGAHWIYIVPLMLGWLYQSMSKQAQKYMYLLYGFILIAMFTNNMYHLYHFISITLKLYPA